MDEDAALLPLSNNYAYESDSDISDDDDDEEPEDGEKEEEQEEQEGDNANDEDHQMQDNASDRLGAPSQSEDKTITRNSGDSAPGACHATYLR